MSLAASPKSFDRQLIAHEVLEDVAHIRDGFTPDPARRDDLNMVKPAIRIVAVLDGFLTVAVYLCWSGVVGAEAEQPLIKRANLFIAEVTIGQESHVLGPCVNVVVDV